MSEYLITNRDSIQKIVDKTEEYYTKEVNSTRVPVSFPNGVVDRIEKVFESGMKYVASRNKTRYDNILIDDFGKYSLAGSNVLTHVSAKVSNKEFIVPEGFLMECLMLRSFDISLTEESEYSGDVDVIVSEQNAFKDCVSLGSIRIKFKDDLADGAFESCSSLKNVYGINISPDDGFLTIGERAFKDCRNLEYIPGPTKNLRRIDEEAFFQSGVKVLDLSNSKNLTKALDSTYGYSSYESCGIRPYAFSKSNIENVILNEGTTVCEHAFDSCFLLTSLVYNGSPHTKALESENASSNTIGQYAFYGCENLSEVTLSYILNNIGSYAFYRCGMRIIEIPASCVSIGSYAFRVCPNLSTVVFYGETPPTLGSSVFSTDIVKYIVVPDSAYDRYESAAGFSSATIKRLLIKYSDYLDIIQGGNVDEG